MVFVVKNKVALVTGGAAGLGLAHVRALLENGAKGVTIADINEETGERVVEELQTEFGLNKVIFVKTDVVNSSSFENAFKVTVETFKYIDILINNAGIFNDAKWESTVDINLKGTIQGVILGMETYLKNHKQGDEAVILNTSSVAGINRFGVTPVYAATKFAVSGLTQCWGDPFHFDRTNVRVVAICPGLTNTALAKDTLDEKKTLRPEYIELYHDNTRGSLELQTTEDVAREAIGVLKKAPNGSLWVIEGGEPAYEYIIEDRQKFKNNFLK